MQSKVLGPKHGGILKKDDDGLMDYPQTFYWHSLFLEHHHESDICGFEWNFSRTIGDGNLLHLCPPLELVIITLLYYDQISAKYIK